MKIKDNIIYLVVGLALFYIFIICTAYLLQRSIIYLPNRSKPILKEWAAVDMQEVQLKTSDGLTLLSWYKPAKNGYPTLMYLQGNMGHIGYRISLIRPYLKQGYGVLLLGYRGYGGNPGNPNEPGLIEDTKAGWKFLRSQKIPSSCIVIYGESLGTGPAIQLGIDYEVAALILYAPYTSLVDLGKHHYPFLPINWLLKDRFDSLSTIAAVHAPILIAVAENDYVVPLRFSASLFKAAKNPKQFVIFPDLGHNDMLQMSQRQMFDFIAKYVHCSTSLELSSRARFLRRTQ